MDTEDLAVPVNAYTITFRNERGVLNFFDVDGGETDAAQFAAAVASNPNYYEVLAVPGVLPEPDPAVKARILERLQRVANGRAYMEQLNETGR